jgi:periplasmic protein TonB
MVCFSVSVLVHVLILIMPIVIMAEPSDFLPLQNAISVNLVEGILQNQKVAAGAVNPTRKQDAQLQETGEGVSFETRDLVSAGYMNRLKEKIFRVWQYPEEAIQKGRQGKVSISFVLNDKGEILDMGILHTSGTYSLDTAAMAAVEQASPFGPFVGQSEEKTLNITGHFCYVLDE